MSTDVKKCYEYLRAQHARALAALLANRDPKERERLQADLARIEAELAQAQR